MYVDKILAIVEEAKHYNYPEMCLRNDLQQVVNEIQHEFDEYEYTARDIEDIKDEYGNERFDDGFDEGKIEGQLELISFFMQAKTIEDLHKITEEADFIKYLEELEKQVRRGYFLY